MENRDTERYTVSWGTHTLRLHERTHIMGVINVTPDSFSDGGKFFTTGQAVAHGEKLVESGADILDIGGESTRPFSKEVSADQEASRVVPVIEKLARSVAVPISIDTTKAVVARQAIDAGASIINDISALRNDPELAVVAAEKQVPVILMHMLGTPGTMQMDPVYENLVDDIRSFLQKAIERALQHGIAAHRIIVDPGIGFGKTIHHNLELIRRLKAFETLNVPLLIGTSRKMFIRKILAGNKENDFDPGSPAVESGTQASVAAAILNGAHIVRVHDVAGTVATVKVIDAIKTA
jgi:dihydropteroate synthase